MFVFVYTWDISYLYVARLSLCFNWIVIKKIPLCVVNEEVRGVQIEALHFPFVYYVRKEQTNSGK